MNSPVFPDFAGVLDAQGRAGPTLNAPPLPSSNVEIVLSFAYCMNNPFDFASNPVEITIGPSLPVICRTSEVNKRGTIFLRVGIIARAM
jgi:hypothetical protein